MPTYDYVCDACGHEFEHRQSMSAARLRTCPQCKKRKLRRLIGSGAGVIFKGSGFYETDYKRKAGGKGGAASRRKGEKAETSSDSASPPPPAEKSGGDVPSGGSSTGKKSADKKGS